MKNKNYFMNVSVQSRVIEIGHAELAVVLGANPSPAEKRVAELLAGRISERTGMVLERQRPVAAFRSHRTGSTDKYGQGSYQMKLA